MYEIQPVQAYVVDTNDIGASTKRAYSLGAKTTPETGRRYYDRQQTTPSFDPDAPSTSTAADPYVCLQPSNINGSCGLGTSSARVANYGAISAIMESKDDRKRAHSFGSWQ